MPKNVVVCCDGTANEFAKHNTNVVKLYSALQHDPALQVGYYHPGLGTMEPAGALSTVARKVTKALGMAIGYGLENDIRDAYVFLMNHFRAGDRLFLFGFSRGAYTVRAVASLLRMVGLIREGNEPLVPYAIRMMRGIMRSRARGKEDVAEYFDLAESFKEAMAGAPCRPHFVGVWDTVSSVGWIENPLKLPYIADNPDIEIGRHAIAIDERRAFFRNHLWRPSTNPARGARPEGLEAGLVSRRPLRRRRRLSRSRERARQDRARMDARRGPGGRVAGRPRSPSAASRAGRLGQVCAGRSACRRARVAGRGLASRRVRAEAALRPEVRERRHGG